MDQERIGKFISSCRKGKGLTQMQLAEMLGITNRAVSKWENGKSCPDASIMLGLCDILGITVNELLSGQRIDMEDYREKAEGKLIEMQAEKEGVQETLSMGLAGLVVAVVLVPAWFAVHSLFPDKRINGARFFVLAAGLVIFAVYFAGGILRRACHGQRGTGAFEGKKRGIAKQAAYLALFAATLYFVYQWCTQFDLHRWDARPGVDVGYLELFGLQALLTFAATKAFLPALPDRDFALGMNAAVCAAFMVMIFQIEMLGSMTREASLVFGMREILNPGMCLLHIAYGALAYIAFKGIAAWWPKDMRERQGEPVGNG